MLRLVKLGQFLPLTLSNLLPSISPVAARQFENLQFQHTSVRFVRSVPKIKEEEVTTGISEDPARIRDQELSDTKKVIDKVNNEIKTGSHGRLFAVIQVAAKQFKVTTNDVIIVQEFWPPNAGDRVRLEKVLLVGGENFTLIGRPMLPRDLVRVEATVLEKTLSFTKFHFVLKKHNSYKRFKFYKSIYTMVRINSIDFDGTVDESKDVEGLRPSQVF